MTLFRPLRLALPLLAALLFVAAPAAQATTAAAMLNPAHTASVDGVDKVLLRGADVVAYRTEGRYVQGSPAHRSTVEGVTLFFASAGNKALFEARPAYYLPQFGGYCANGIAYAIPWGGDADTWRIIDDKLYIFGGAGSRAAFELDVAGNRALAERYWTEEVAGSNAFFQRYTRLIFRVPHYKSNEQLAAELAAARGTKP